MVARTDILKHELAHAIGFLIAGALAVKVIALHDRGEATPAWSGNDCSPEQFLSGIVAGRAHVTDGMDLSADEEELALADPALVAELSARVLPVVEDRLECVNRETLAAMLSVIDEDGALLLTPEAIH